jgi:hypothetical protein
MSNTFDQDPISELGEASVGEIANTLVGVERMSRDLKKAALNLGDDEARFLVSAYYMMQGSRIRTDNQVKALGKAEEPNEVLQFFSKQWNTLESQVKGALDNYTKGHLMGSWMREIYGIGPVISAGLLAHLDINKAPTSGHFESFAGLNPMVIWPSTDDALKWIKQNGLDIHAACAHFRRNYSAIERYATRDADGEEVKLTERRLAKALSRRPWNAELKVVVWKAGQSFKMFNKKEECYYGKLYNERKVFEIQKNMNGDNRAFALAKAERVGKDTDAYKSYIEGMLPPAHIDARATRWTTKIFLSHLHAEWYRRAFGKEPPVPYPIAHLGHAHLIKPPF